MTFGSFCTKYNDSELQTLQPESVTIKGKQTGFFTNLEIIQAVENKTSKDLNEVIYIFPTDNRLCIYGLTFYIGKEKIEAKINKKNQATEIFNEAKSNGQTTIMSENVSPGITTIKVGNFPKNETIKVVLNCSLMSQLISPTKILTKIPLHGCDANGYFLDLADVPSLTINVDLTIDQISEIQQVNVNCDEYDFDQIQKKLLIQSSIVTSDNLLIEVELSEKVESQMVKCGKVTALSVIPEFESKSKSNQNKEFIFLVDCSASMIGDSIAKAKESIYYFISHLPMNSMFNIIQFGTTYKKLFNESVKAINENKYQAKKEVEKIKANLGGTQMLELFKELFQPEQLTQREIFIITDGEVFMREEVVKLIEQNADFNRIFAIGLGNGADAGFLEEIAEITNGKSDFVFDSKDLLSKVVEQLELSLVDSAIDTEIHLSNESDVQIVPYPLPPLMPGVLHNFFIYESSESTNNENVLITAKIPNQSNEIEIVVSNEFAKEIKVDKNQKNPLLPLFAQKQLKRIQDKDEEKSTKLSLESGVLCKYTSYIGVSSIKYVDNEASNDYYSSRSDYILESLDRAIEIGDYYSSRSDYILESLSLDGKECQCEMSYHACFCRESQPVKRSMFWSSISSMASKLCFWRNFEKKSPPPTTTTTTEYEYHDSMRESEVFNSCFSDNDPEIDYHNDERIESTFDPNHSWENDASVIDIVKMQSRDGFWDISTKFIESHFMNNKIPVIQICIGNAMIEKRVRSTVFVLAFLLKYLSENEKVLKNANQKALKWLNKINRSENWNDIILNFKENIQRKNIDDI